jgi:HlyD family secretion protein
MKRLVFRLVWPVLIVLIVAGYVHQSRRPVRVDLAFAQRGYVEEVVEEEASTQLHSERIISPAFPGTAARIEFEVGDRLRRDQLITTIEDKDLLTYRDVILASIEETQGRIDGADVTLPKPSEIAAARKDAQRAEEEVVALSEDVKAAEADLRFARSELERITDLAEEGSLSRQQLERTQRDHDVAQAVLSAATTRLAAARTARQAAELRVKVLEESLQDTAHLRRVYGAQIEQSRKQAELIDRQLEKTRITCPIDGVVLEKYLDSEGYVQQGTPLLKVGAPGSIEIRSDILSDEIGRVHVGQTVHLIGPALSDSKAMGRVKQIYPSGFTKISSLGVRQQRVAVLIDFDNNRLNLKPGAELDVQIVVDSKGDALLVPVAAVIATAEGAAVFAVRDGKAVCQPVAIGLRGKEAYEVTEGLSEGESVILRPPKDLSEGRRVKANPGKGAL